MGYASIVEVDLILPQALTSARPDGSEDKIKLINIPGANPDNPVGVNRIPDDVVEYYISLADKQIDGVISQQYKMPLALAANGQWLLDADIDEYNQVVEISSTHNLVVGDQIVIRDDAQNLEEDHVVASITDQNTIVTLNPIDTFFSGPNIRVIRIGPPPPVSQISARLAASFIYDKYFAAQNEPNISEYGKEMRGFAMGQLNDILNGRTILENQLRIGDRFGNPWLDDNYSLRDRGFDTSSRDMSTPK